MKQACHELFVYASRQVTVKDIADFCPNDPGYSNYVREFTRILSTGILPEASHFDITETICLTWWDNASVCEHEVRYRWFRTFTNSVGMALLAGSEGPGDRMPPNYLAIRLIEDAYALQDDQLLALLCPVFVEAHTRILETGWMAEEAPFLLLGQLIVSFLVPGTSIDTSELADQLIEEADQHAGHASNEFLWGCTSYDQFQDLWHHFIRLSFPADASNDSVAALRDALL